jgi:hypothetical protein
MKRNTAAGPPDPPEVRTEDDLDRSIAESAEREAEAQLAIVRALKTLKRDEQLRVIEAVMHILEAEKRVPGVLAAIGSGRKTRGTA